MVFEIDPLHDSWEGARGRPRIDVKEEQLEYLLNCPNLLRVIV